MWASCVIATKKYLEAISNGPKNLMNVQIAFTPVKEKTARKKSADYSPGSLNSIQLL